MNTHLLKIMTSDQTEHRVPVTAQEKTHLPTLHQELQQMVEEWCQQQGIAVATLHSWDYDYL